jgi:hypothetical protein
MLRFDQVLTWTNVHTLKEKKKGYKCASLILTVARPDYTLFSSNLLLLGMVVQVCFGIRFAQGTKIPSHHIFALLNQIDHIHHSLTRE